MTLVTSIAAGESKLGRVDEKLARACLIAFTILAIIPRLELGSLQFIHYDGYWHIFIASQNRWQLFKSEWRGDAHPILYYLLLRIVSIFAHSHLAYRGWSILPNLASVYLLGVVAQKTLANIALAPVAAAAFAFSTTIIDIGIDVRGYALALMLVIWTYSVFLDLVDETHHDQPGMPLIKFGVLSSLAITTEYYAVFFAASCWTVILILTITQRSFRQAFSRLMRRHRFQFALAIALPLFTLVWLYIVHLKYQPHVESNVLDFYWDRHIPALQFIANGLVSDLNFMLPFQIESTAVLVILLVAWITCSVYSALKPVDGLRRLAPATAGLMLLLLTGQLAALGLLRRYPFGGYARQQSILFPFFVLSGFVMADRFVSAIPRSGVRLSAAVALLVAICWNFHSQWQKLPRISTELFTAEFGLFESKFQRASAVYVDQFSLIAYYTHTHNARWKFRRHLLGLQRADTYDVIRPTGKPTTLLRNLDSWNFDLSSSAFYAVAADLIRQARLASVTLFFVKQGGQNVPDQVQAERRESIRLNAERFGLIATQIVLTQQDAFVTFVLQ